MSGLQFQGNSEAADVWETLELLREVVFIEHRVCTVLHHLQRHRAKHRRKLVDALGSEDAEHKSVLALRATSMGSESCDGLPAC